MLHPIGSCSIKTIERLGRDALMRRWTPLADKQRAWLDDIVARLERAEAV
jgi:hypothetical protein